VGTSFVTLANGDEECDVGFWIQDAMLELWLRLLSLHLPEPNTNGENQATLAIRNQWLLASRGYFLGCIPHGLEEACATHEGRNVIRIAIDSLMSQLCQAPAALDANVLNLLGIEGRYSEPLEKRCLEDIGYAFIDLLEGRVVQTAASVEIIPGSIPYKRQS